MSGTQLLTNDGLEAASPEVFIQNAATAMTRSKVRLGVNKQRQWFATLLNSCYAPVVRRGFSAGMAPVFDIGVVLFEPQAEVLDSANGHGELLGWLRSNPALCSAARQVLAAAERSGRDNRDQVVWTIMEPLLRCLQGAWAPPEANRRTELPHVEFDLAGFNYRVAESEPRPITLDWPHAKPDAEGTLKAVLPPVSAVSIRIFAALIARLLPNWSHRLDHEVVEACLLGPGLAQREREPPPRVPIETATQHTSKKPGDVGGVTRVQIRLPTDPIVRILPSEWMLMLKDRQMGMARLIRGGQQVIKLELEKDEIPRHRGLVCLVVDADQPMAGIGARPAGPQGGGRVYRSAYVYAKRQVFDVLRDLRSALEAERLGADIEIDVAIHVVRAGHDIAVAHAAFPLHDMPLTRTGHPGIDRLTAMMDLANRLPAFFIRDFNPGLSATRIRAASRAADPDLSHLLRQAVTANRYHMIHIIPIACQERSDILKRLHRMIHSHASAHIRIHQIQVHTDRLDPDIRLSAEPAWSYAASASTREALAIDPAIVPDMPLATLRNRLTSAVFGNETEPSGTALARVQLELEG